MSMYMYMYLHMSLHEHGDCLSRLLQVALQSGGEWTSPTSLNHHLTVNTLLVTWRYIV